MPDYSVQDHEEADMIARVVEVLDRRIDLNHRQKFHTRKLRRNPYSGRVMLHLPREILKGIPDDQRQPSLFLAWSRHISRGGMTLLTRRDFHCKEVIVGLTDQGDAPIWIRAEIAKKSPAPLGFQEYGLIFCEKV